MNETGSAPIAGQTFTAPWGEYLVLRADERTVRYRFRACGGKEREAAMPLPAFERLIKAAGCARKVETDG